MDGDELAGDGHPDLPARHGRHLGPLPMHLRGTDHCLPAALTSIVEGTVCTLTSPIICSDPRLPRTGLRYSFSFMNSRAGGRPVVSLGFLVRPGLYWAIIEIGSASSSKSPVC